MLLLKTALLLFAFRSWVVDANSWQYAVFGVLINLSYTLIAVRTFRGYLEPAVRPRPWWRWTGRPKAGYWLGALYLLAGISAIQNFWPQNGLATAAPLTILSILESVFVAFGYLNSSFRLRGRPASWSQRRRNSPALPNTNLPNTNLQNTNLQNTNLPNAKR
jgi:hypothetical protein